jgi:hypothetical protein
MIAELPTASRDAQLTSRFLPKTPQFLPKGETMRSRLGKPMWIGALAGLTFVGATAAAEPVTPEEFQQLMAAIKPLSGEDKWAEIPWRSSLWQARKQAAAEGKPLLLWEMDGHPLGCV